MRSAAANVGLFLAVLVVLWALWEGFKAFGEAVDLRLGQFEPNDRTMPHLHDIVGTLFEPSRRNGPLLIDILWDAALFTAKEAAFGFLLGAFVGFVLGAAPRAPTAPAGSCRTSLPRRRSRSSRWRPWWSSG